ncbi:acetylcholine receptor subunit alpha-like 1 [Caerostris darwini]|uniref:Acetylcholine receptor subunit alpha-like 1 n=1 Tax=Caerostris darwini TaxID=1538125 RepID=A0AAV4NLQ9_9ARAC|nr:acetylcholine receptor subunit alpha-like 1 [Caerostris darwini]
MSAIGISLLLCFVIGTVTADGHKKSESDLRRALFYRHDKLVRPVKDINDVVDVLVEMAPIGIKDVDIKDRTLKLDTWLFMQWEDQHFTWNPAEYGGLHQLNLPASEIWKPDIAIYTATPDEYMLPKVHTNVVLLPNGTVIWVPPFTVKTRCEPTEGASDNQDIFLCSIKLGSWTYDVSRLRILERNQNILQFICHFNNNYVTRGAYGTPYNLLCHYKSQQIIQERYSHPPLFCPI